jgi:hypothetical protein
LSPPVTQTSMSPPVNLRKLAPLAAGSLVIGALLVAGVLGVVRSPRLLPTEITDTLAELDLSRVLPTLQEAHSVAPEVPEAPVVAKVVVPARAPAPPPPRMTPLRKDLSQLPKPKLKNPFDNH